MPGNGSQVNFEFDFIGGYISQSHIVVTLIDADNVETITSFTWAGAYTVTLPVAPPVGTTVRIRRLTPVLPGEIVDFSAGAVVNEANLDKIIQHAVMAAADAADMGLIAADEVRRDVAAFNLWSPADLVEHIKDALLAALPASFKGDKGDVGDASTVPGPVGPAPALTIGNVTNVATGGPATAGLRPNGEGAYFLDLGLPIGATGSGASVSWGGVLGDIADQSDLIALLDEKATLADLTAYALQTDLDDYATTAAVTTALAGKSNTGHSHDFSTLTGKPTTLAGYGITDAAASSHTHTFASLTGKPTTLAGYGITDAAASTHNHDATYAKKATVSTVAPSGGTDGDVWYKV